MGGAVGSLGEHAQIVGPRKRNSSTIPPVTDRRLQNELPLGPTVTNDRTN